jgi:NAD(P)-dependent dehydrogenase (short-subunit alcohol dehydrogenase family)
MATISSLMSLKNRLALVTGAGGNLGFVIAESLLELQANVILVDIQGSNLENVRERLLDKASANVYYHYCNLESLEERNLLISSVKDKYKNLDILVNNAAFTGNSTLSGWSVPFDQQSILTWRRAVEVNLTAPFHLCQGLSDCLSKGTGANIINIASIYGQLGPDFRLYDNTSMGNPAAYGASKGGLIQLTRWLSTTLAPSIRVNSICPGGIYRHQPDSFVEKYIARTPLQRMAKEDDFRGAIAYLASDLSCYVTGQILSVDGGWGVW